MGSGWSGLVPCASQPCESNKRVYTGTTRTFTPFYFARGMHCKTWTAPQELGHHDDYHDQGALSYAMCLLTAPGTWGTGTARGRGICPGSSRQRARVP